VEGVALVISMNSPAVGESAASQRRRWSSVAGAEAARRAEIRRKPRAPRRKGAGLEFIARVLGRWPGSGTAVQATPV
jgi:hypothetical protein